MKKAIVSLSGGMDSATVLAIACQDREVLSVSFSYPSKHNAYEKSCAIKLAKHYNTVHKIIDLYGVFHHFKSNLLNQGGLIPEGHYEEESMRQTVVPLRNMIFGSILGGIAVSEGISEIWMGIHAGDHFIYPDCRPAFLRSLELTMELGSDTTKDVMAPFLYEKKSYILKSGLALKVPYDLTRTCYKAQQIACGKCGSCQERLEAFQSVNVEDPLEYETRELVKR